MGEKLAKFIPSFPISVTSTCICTCTFTKVGARACFLSHGQVKIGYISKTVPTCVGEKLPDQQIIGK